MVRRHNGEDFTPGKSAFTTEGSDAPRLKGHKKRPDYFEARDGGFGGDGGESNSPSRRSYPEYTTSLVSSFILPG